MSPQESPSPSQVFDEIVKRRQTVKIFDGRAVEKAQIEQLLEWAVLAPNHRLNEPWRFRVLLQSDILRMRSDLEPAWRKSPNQSFMKTWARLEKVGALIDVRFQKSENKLIHEENHSATAAAVEHILLGASSLGIDSFWSSGLAFQDPSSLEWLKIDPQEAFAASIWLGYAQERPIRPLRRKTQLAIHWLS